MIVNFKDNLINHKFDIFILISAINYWIFFDINFEFILGTCNEHVWIDLFFCVLNKNSRMKSDKFYFKNWEDFLNGVKNFKIERIRLVLSLLEYKFDMVISEKSDKRHKKKIAINFVVFVRKMWQRIYF